MKGDASKSAFISFHLFFRIGAFQWVTSKKIKKTPFARRSRLGLCANASNPIFLTPFRFMARPAAITRMSDSASEKGIA
jgi:hypothetical protein